MPVTCRDSDTKCPCRLNRQWHWVSLSLKEAVMCPCHLTRQGHLVSLSLKRNLRLSHSITVSVSTYILRSEDNIFSCLSLFEGCIPTKTKPSKNWNLCYWLFEKQTSNHFLRHNLLITFKTTACNTTDSNISSLPMYKHMCKSITDEATLLREGSAV